MIWSPKWSYTCCYTSKWISKRTTCYSKN